MSTSKAVDKCCRPRQLLASTCSNTSNANASIQHWQPAAPCAVCDSGLKSTPVLAAAALRFRGPAWSRGNLLAISVNSSRTFSAVFADVSKNSRPASLAYCWASAVGMARLSGFSLTKSSLFPARAITMFSFAWRWSSFTQAFALSSDDYSQVRSMEQQMIAGLTAWVISKTTTAQFALR
jgi:hypothetical protein